MNPAELAPWLNLTATAVGFGLSAITIGRTLGNIENKLDTLERNVEKVEGKLDKDVERLERIVHRHGEQIARLEARSGHPPA